MGEVYQAKDARLDRSVAVRVLPPEFSADPDRRAGRLPGRTPQAETAPRIGVGFRPSRATCSPRLVRRQARPAAIPNHGRSLGSRPRGPPDATPALRSGMLHDAGRDAGSSQRPSPRCGAEGPPPAAPQAKPLLRLDTGVVLWAGPSLDLTDEVVKTLDGAMQGAAHRRRLRTVSCGSNPARGI